MTKAHHEDGRQHGVDAVRPDAGAVQDAAHERQLIPEQRAILDAEEDLEVALRTRVPMLSVSFARLVI